MKVWKIVLGIVIVFALCLVGCIFYAFKIEPYRLEINQYKINADAKTKMNMKIVQFSDLHIKEDFTYKEIDKVIDKINAQNPDLVIFTGDLYDNYAKYNDDARIIEKLKSMEAKYGKIAIWGNRDYGGGAVRQYESIMEQSDFTLLRNESIIISDKNGKKIRISGVDDSLLGNPMLPESVEESDYQILLTHESELVDDFVNANYDLILSGHSHGGQINIPFLPHINKKAIATTAFSSKYSGGLYQIKENSSTLYVNTGIGTTHISARFGVTPEIAILEI